LRKSLTVFTAAGATAAVALLAACSSGSQGVNTLPSSTASQSRVASGDLMRSGVAPKFLSLIRSLQGAHVVNPAKKKKGLKDLYVSDFGTGAVEILANGTWTETGTITSGLDGPDGIFADKKGNVYVANYAGLDIQEYAPNGTSPSFTYNASMIDPIGVDVDAKGNVYEADYDDGGGAGPINEYAQGTNTVLNTCSPGGSVEDVAVDKAGDVFADLNFAAGGAGVVEYKGGLSGCSETTLITSLSFAGGMAMDKHGNLLVCDQLGPTVDVIKPPYTSVSGTLGSGYSDPFHVTINKKNNQAYVADLGNANVQVLSYPSGSNVATLNSANGLSDPAAAVDGQNEVP
jgi:DNA-binding beta-propeller fold protein YncE